MPSKNVAPPRVWPGRSPRSAPALSATLTLTHRARARPQLGKCRLACPILYFSPSLLWKPYLCTLYGDFCGGGPLLYCCGVSGAALRCCTLEWPFCWTQSLGKKKPHSHSYPMKMENLQEWEPIMQMGLYWGCIVTRRVTYQGRQSGRVWRVYSQNIL